jgi:hypothetical protein
MVAKKNKTPAKKVRSLPAKGVSAKQARTVKGGDKASQGKPKPGHLNFEHYFDTP